MEIKIVKNEKNVEIIRAVENKGVATLSSDQNSGVRMGKISNKVLERIGGLETFVRRFNRLYSNTKLKFTLVDPAAPEVAPEVAPTPEPEVAPTPEPEVAPAQG
jgi:hypothetical protein